MFIRGGHRPPILLSSIFNTTPPSGRPPRFLLLFKLFLRSLQRGALIFPHLSGGFVLSKEGRNTLRTISRHRVNSPDTSLQIRIFFGPRTPFREKRKGVFLRATRILKEESGRLARRGTFGLRRQSATTTALWIDFPRGNAEFMQATSAESKAAWRFASRRTPQRHRVFQLPACDFHI